MVESVQNIVKEKDLAIASLVCGLLIWVPLFNAVLGPLALLFGILSLKKIYKNPDQYGGKWASIIGIILGVISVIFLVVTLYIKIFKPELLVTAK